MPYKRVRIPYADQNHICTKCGVKFSGPVYRGLILCRPHYRETNPQVAKTHERVKAYNREYTNRRNKEKKPCINYDICSNLAIGASKECYKCKYARRSADRVCINCNNEYKGTLHFGKAICRACKATPKDKLTAANKANRRRALKAGSKFIDISLSWHALWKEGRRYCEYCGIMCDPTDRQGRKFGASYPTIDHMQPLSIGGKHTRENIVLACWNCNQLKGARSARFVTSEELIAKCPSLSTLFT